MNSRNTRDVMITFQPPVLKAIDAYCKRTGLKRSTAVMQAVQLYLVGSGAPAGLEPEPRPEHEPQPARTRGTASLKAKLKRR